MEARGFQVDLVPLLVAEIAAHRVTRTMRVTFQTANGCMMI